MSLSNNEILIQNIIECSTDAKRSSAEIDLLLFELIFGEKLEHRSISDIKNEVICKYGSLQKERKRQHVEASKFEIAHEQLLICKYLSTHFGREFIPEITEMPTRNSSSIAYWHSNKYAKEAYLKFERLFDVCNHLPVESFTAVCENINGDEILGIIPIINSSDGRLMSFYRLIDKYDLKISAVCKIENPDSDGFTKFALVGKHLVNIDNKDKKIIEFATTKSISDIVAIVEYIGGNIGEITSVPFIYNNTKYTNYINISVDSALVYTVCLYMYMFVGEIDFIGLYTEI